MAKNLLYLDLETSGLEPSEGATILGIGAIFHKLDVKKPVVEEFSALITPTEMQWQLASPKALEVNGLTLERLVREGQPFGAVRDRFLRWLAGNLKKSKFTCVGQNPAFDLKFISALMGGELGFIGLAFDDVVDLRDLYSILVNRRQVPFLKYRSLKNICLAVGVEPEPEVHDALEGARALARAHQKVADMLRTYP